MKRITQAAIGVLLLAVFARAAATDVPSAPEATGAREISAERATFSTSNGTLSVCAVGAQVTNWRPAALGGEEVFFLQESPQWGKEVHGGVPICWPWFGGRAGAPSHGLVRYVKWRLNAGGRFVETPLPGSASGRDAPTARPLHGGRFVETPLPDVDSLAFVVESSPETKAIWPHDFRLVAEISMPGPDILEIAVTEKNTGETAFESAFGLHPYFAVSDATCATLDGAAAPSPDGSTLKFAADGLPHVLGDPARGVRIEVSMDDADSWRLWNPGEPNRYVAAGEWRRFFCLEPIRATPSPLAPGASRTRIVRIRARRFAIQP